MSDKQVAISKTETPTQSDIERAIAYLSKMEEEKAIKAGWTYGGTKGMREAESEQELLNTALHALRDARDRQGCEYCIFPSDDCETTAFHTKPDWILNDRNDCIEANFCPACGKRLSENPEQVNQSEIPTGSEGAC